MKFLKDALSKGQLNGAIETVQDRLRQEPMAADLRAALVELLAIAGELERADEALERLARQHPDWLPGTANLRQLLRAQQTRVAFGRGQMSDAVVAQPGPALEALLTLHLRQTEGDLDAATEAAEKLESIRSTVSFQVAETTGSIRDCDDSVSAWLEALGTDGCYYLWEWSEIESVRFSAPTSPLELVWRRGRVTLSNGREGDVFMPLTYAGSVSEAERLGQATDWACHTDRLVTGRGLKTWLVGDAVVTAGASESMERVPEEATANAL